jgi:DNA-binding PadR family transcriptional regulator
MVNKAHYAGGTVTMRSPVNWALLGLVIERPSYGYELAQRFDTAYGDVLNVSSASHIYTALNALQARSLIEQMPSVRALQPDAARQPKPHYRATELGVRSYRDRLVVQMREDRSRSQLLVRQLAALMREPEAALDVLDRYEQACLEEASRVPMYKAQDSADASGLVSRLTSEENRLAADARLAWVQYARREFAVLARDRGTRPR